MSNIQASDPEDDVFGDVRGVVGNALEMPRGENELHSWADQSGLLRHALHELVENAVAVLIDDVIALLRAWQVAPPTEPPRRQPPGRAPPLPLGPVPLHPKGPEPQKFNATPGFTSADVVKAQLDRGAKMAILDARAPSDYTTNHIAGAVSVPFYAPEPYLSDLPKDAWLVCYCGCPHAESGNLARKLGQNGFTKVTVIDDGLGYYSFVYNGGHTAFVGVMAQEVQTVVPEAVTHGADGYLRVSYDLLGVPFETYQQWVLDGAHLPSVKPVAH